MAPKIAPVAAVNASGTAHPGNKRLASRTTVRPVLPLTFTRRPKPVIADNTKPSSPLRTNSDTAPPTPTQDHKELPQPSPESDAVEPLTNGHKSDEEAPAPPVEPEKADAGVTPVEADDSLASQEEESRPVTAGAQTHGTSTPTQSQTTGETTPPDTLPSVVPSSASYPPTTLSPPPFNNGNNMGPPFYPTNFRGPAPEPARLPSQPLHPQRIHQYQQHQPHLSNGSMLFGYHGSNASSPAPLPGATFPTPMHMSHEQGHFTGMDNFGQPILATTSLNGHGPVNHGPLTPHSFHGSQSSSTAAELANRQVVNGNNGVDVGRPGPPPGLAHPPRNSNHHGSFNPSGFQAGQAMGLPTFADHISSLFARPDFADCDVVLDLPDRLTPINSAHAAGLPNGPLRLPGHQLVLAHHPLLRRIIAEMGQQSDGPREVHIASNDPFLRADSMWRAIKYLYGFCYVPLPHEVEKQSDVEKFHFVLGYAAAGARLEVPDVSITAVREAAELLSWDTVEKGIEFALAGLEYSDPRPRQVPHAFPQFQYRHGSYVGDLVDKMMFFIATNFPRDFVLHTAVQDPRYTRLPMSHPGGEAQDQHLSRGNGPSHATGINIKFGDMEPHETNGHSQTHHAQSPGSHLAALSRILLNLPYEMLKLLLESNSLGEVPGWRTVQDRRRAMSAVVAEREARREGLIREMAGGRLEQHVPVDALRSKEPRFLQGNWSNLCWKEECIYRPEGPVMNRTWTPLSDAY